MRLSDKEFKAMNHPFRKLLQRRVELPCFKKMGLSITGQNVLEIGCGSGYGAQLLTNLKPESYTGIDLMPEQIAIAEQRNLQMCTFNVMNATDLSAFKDSTYKVIIIFGILHHIPAWRDVLKEIYCILKPGGQFFLEEPDINILKKWDFLFHWDHPGKNDFSLKTFEEYSSHLGFIIEKQYKIISFGFYRLSKQDK